MRGSKPKPSEFFQPFKLLLLGDIDKCDEHALPLWF